MTPTVLRKLWSLVETTQASFLLRLDDAALGQWLYRQLEAQTNLDRDEADSLNAYIRSRLVLIREFAHQR